MLDEELARRLERPEAAAATTMRLFRELAESPSFADFLTLPAYDLIAADLAQAAKPSPASLRSAPCPAVPPRERGIKLEGLGG